MKKDEMIVEDVPVDVRSAVDEQAEEESTNRNDVVLAILAKRFGGSHAPTGYPYRASDSSSDSLYLRTSGDVLKAVRKAARKASAPGRQIAASRLIISTLQSHYGLAVDSPRRRSNVGIDPAIVREARARHEAGESLRSLAKFYDVHRPTLTKAIRAST